MVKSYLEEIQKLDKHIQNKLVELYQLKCLATSVTAQTDREPVQTSGVSDKVGNTVTKMIMLEEEINRLIDRFVDEKVERIKLIEQLENPLYYTVVHKHYVQYKSLVVIAEEEQFSYDYIIEVHGKALRTLENQWKPM